MGEEAFDVVVVGGGAAGCVVAARVSESASRSVLLVEAGPDLRAQLPGELRDGWRLASGYDWGLVSEADARRGGRGPAPGEAVGWHLVADPVSLSEGRPPTTTSGRRWATTAGLSTRCSHT